MKQLTHKYNRIEKGLSYNYTERRLKKRYYKSEWIKQINSGVRILGTTYSQMINLIKKKAIILNRKVLGELVKREPNIFKEVIIIKS